MGRSEPASAGATPQLPAIADEAFADLLVKHGHPIDVKNQLRASLGKVPIKRPDRRKKPDAGS